MKRTAIHRLGWISIALALAGCESTRVAPISGESTVLAEDEARLWTRAAQESDVLNRSGLLVRNAALDDYLNRMLAELYPDPLPRGGRWRAHVLADPTLNAFILPDGAVYVHTGMLARLENEAQLATVLAHELTHATHRHALKSFRHLKNQSNFLATFTVGTGGVGGLLGLLGTAASVSGYSQDLEREADREGFRLLVAAGYDPREAPKVFQALLDESRRSKIKQPYFFGSHPRLGERIDTFSALAAAQPVPAHPRLGVDAYNLAMAGIFAANAAAALEAGDHDAALASVKRGLAGRPDDVDTLFIEAEIHRRRNGADDAARALECYRALLLRPDAPPAARRGLGLVLFREGDKTGAAEALRTYLQLDPLARDRAHIEHYLALCATAP